MHIGSLEFYPRILFFNGRPCEVHKPSERVYCGCKAMKGAWKWYFRGRWNRSRTPGAEIRVKLFLCRVQPLEEHKGWHCELIVYLKQTLPEQFSFHRRGLSSFNMTARRPQIYQLGFGQNPPCLAKGEKLVRW